MGFRTSEIGKKFTLDVQAIDRPVSNLATGAAFVLAPGMSHVARGWGASPSNRRRSSVITAERRKGGIGRGAGHNQRDAEICLEGPPPS
jgi:hypothetical protein